MSCIGLEHFVKPLLRLIFFYFTFQFTIDLPCCTRLLYISSSCWLDMGMANKLFYWNICNEEVKTHHITSRGGRYWAYGWLRCLLALFKIICAVSFLTRWEIFLWWFCLCEAKGSIGSNKIRINVYGRLLFWQLILDVLWGCTIVSLRYKCLWTLLRYRTLRSLHCTSLSNFQSLLLSFDSPSFL